MGDYYLSAADKTFLMNALTVAKSKGESAEDLLTEIKKRTRIPPGHKSCIAMAIGYYFQELDSTDPRMQLVIDLADGLVSEDF